MATEDICNEFDMLSNLPESLLCSNILSVLTLTDAVRSSILARKWRYLWTKIPHLHFSADFFRHVTFSVEKRPLFGLYSSRVRRIKETMDHILNQHGGPLESFRFHLPKSINVDVMDIRQCIQHATKKGVKRMVLEVETTYLERKMRLPSTVFKCITLVDLEIVSFTIPEIPIVSESFSFMRNCCLCDIGNLTDHNLQKLVEFCPFLHELALIECRELMHLRIRAPNLSYMILVGCSYVQSLTADCPQLLQLQIRDRSSLAKLQLNSFSLLELKLRDCYKLSTLHLNSCVFLKEGGSVEGLSMKEHSNVKSLKKLSLKRCSSALSGFPCSTLFGIFPDLEELHVASCMMGIAVIRGEEQAACEMEMVSDVTFPNLKNVFVDISSDMSEKEVAVLGFLLRNTPSLQTLTLSMPYCPEGIDDREFRDQLLGLKRAASSEPEVEIIWEEDSDGDVQDYNEGSYVYGNDSINRGE